MTPAKKASLYREVIKLREVNEHAFSDIALKKGKTRQYWHQIYCEACEWREKYGEKK